jgi:hypothetical protein
VQVAHVGTEREKRRDRLPCGPDPGRERKRLTTGPSGFLNMNRNQNFAKLDSIQTLDSKAQKKLEKIYCAAWFGVKSNFCYWCLVQFFTDFELKFRFHPGFEFGEAGDLSALCTLLQMHKCITLGKKNIAP